MTDERIIEEMARIQFKGCCYRNKSEIYRLVKPEGHAYPSFHAPCYLTLHDALQPLIDGMDDATITKYGDELFAFFYDAEDMDMLVDYAINQTYKATPRQKCEAILKAYGKWGES